jgi:hypothetical protein
MANGTEGQKHAEETPSGMRRAISTGLIGSGFASIGSAMGSIGSNNRGGDPNVSAAWMQLGNNISKAMENRRHMKDFETFQTEHVQPFMESQKGLMGEYTKKKNALIDGNWIDANGNDVPLDLNTYEGRERAIRYRGQLDTETSDALANLSINLANEGSKYIRNPMINNQIQKMHEAASTTMSSSINPEGTLAAESSLAETDYRRKAGDAALMQSRAAGRAGKEKRITGLAQAQQQLGAGGLGPWLLGTPEGQTILDSDSGQAYLAEAKADLEAQIKRKNPMITEEELKVALGPHRVRLNQLAAGKIISASLGERAAAAVALYNPSLFPDPNIAGQARAAVTTRQSPKETKEHIESWQKKSMDQLHEELAKVADPPDSVEEAINIIMEKWLPAAMSGDLEREDLSDLTVANTQTTAQHRASIVEAVRPYLEKYWRTGEAAAVTRGLFPEEAAQAVQTQREERMSRPRVRGRPAPPRDKSRYLIPD